MSVDRELLAPIAGRQALLLGGPLHGQRVDLGERALDELEVPFDTGESDSPDSLIFAVARYRIDRNAAHVDLHPVSAVYRFVDVEAP